jgi:hypothetical protein
MKWLLAAFIITFIYIANPVHTEATEESKVWFYIDGQEQKYVGDPILHNGDWWLPLRPVLTEAAMFNPDLNQGSIDVQNIMRVLNEERKRALLEEEEEPREEWVVQTEEEKEYDEILYFLAHFTLDFIQNRDVIRLSDVALLGFDHYIYEQQQIIHLSSPHLMTIANINLGERRTTVNSILQGIHWNTGFGVEADYIGFYGDENQLTYRDRYGYERIEKAYDIQIEIIEDGLSHIFVSDSAYETSKGIKVGDRMNEAIRAYGNQFIRESIDGKQVVIYEVELGSIWFIADADQTIERIGFWDHHLRGFGEIEEELETAEDVTNVHLSAE